MARIVFTLEDGTEIEIELDAEVITVGRHTDSIVVLPSSSVSSHHATIRQRGDSYYVQDLGTTNGTRLNGVEVEEARLEDGDQLMFGDIPAVVHLSVAPITRGVPTAPVPIPVPLAAAAPVASKYATSRSMPVAPGPRRSTRPVQQYEESSGCAGFLTFLLFLVLAFAVGLHVRHGVETGGFLIGDVIKKVRDKASDGVEKDAAPATKDEGKAPVAPTPAPAKARDASAPAAPSMMNGDAPMSNMAPAMSGDGAMSEMAPKPAAPAMMEMN